jgi:DNA-binding protein YbaB
MSGPTRPMITAADLHEHQRRTMERIQTAQVRAQAAKAELAANTVTKSSPDRAVTITVNPGGGLMQLKFGPGAERKPLSQLAGVIMSTYRAATTEAVAQTMELMQRAVGDDAETFRVLRANIPPQAQIEDPQVQR